MLIILVQKNLIMEKLIRNIDKKKNYLENKLSILETATNLITIKAEK